MSAQTKTCPVCAQDIGTEARFCRFCGAGFDVATKGYCSACHTVVDTDENGRCPNCHGEIVDAHVESRLAAAGPASPVQSPAGPYSQAPPVAAGPVAGGPAAGAAPTVSTAGWIPFAVPELELWLPASYIGGDPRQGFDSVMARAQAAGPGFAAEFAHQSRSGKFTFLALDTVLGPSGRPRTVAANQSLPALVELEALLAGVIRQLPRDLVALEVAIVQLPLYQAGRMVLEVREKKVFGGGVGRATLRMLQFQIKGRQVFCGVTYTADPYDFGQALPVFEQSIRTVRLWP